MFQNILSQCFFWRWVESHETNTSVQIAGARPEEGHAATQLLFEQERGQKRRFGRVMLDRLVDMVERLPYFESSAAMNWYFILGCWRCCRWTSSTSRAVTTRRWTRAAVVSRRPICMCCRICIRFSRRAAVRRKDMRAAVLSRIR